jgi:hypothetical protein
MKKSIAIHLKNKQHIVFAVLIFILSAYTAQSQTLGGLRSMSAAVPLSLIHI